jgi:carbon-monoxide dehydrogenase large subunit
MAAYLFSVTPEEIQLSLKVAITDMRSGQSITLKEFASVLYSQREELLANVREELSVTKALLTQFPGLLSPGTHIAQVEVDSTFLSVKILRYVVVEDCRGGTLIQ